MKDESSAGVLTQRLRRAGLRVTRPRLAVYGVLLALGGHRSADEIATALDRRGESLPRTSVYNVIEALRDAGLVLVADAGPGRALFEAAGRPHHHFVCRGCGTVIDVPCATGVPPCVDPVPAIAAAGGRIATVDEAQVIFRGRCADCAAG